MQDPRRSAIDNLRPLVRLWQLLASPALTLALLGGLLLLACLALLFPQMPEGLRGDPSAYGEWVTGLRARYGGASELLRSAGLLSLANSPAMRFLLVALGLNCAVAIAERASRVWGGRTTLDEGDALVWAEDSPAEGIMERLLSAFVELGFRVGLDEERRSLSARRFPIRQLLIIGALVGLLLALGGRLWDGRQGATIASLQVGFAEPVVAFPGVELQLERGRDDASQDAVSLVIKGANKLCRAEDVSTRWFVRCGDVIARLIQVRPALIISARDRDGTPIPLRTRSPAIAQGSSSAELRFRGSGDEAYLALPGRSISYRVAYYTAVPQQGIEEPVIHVQAIRSGTPAPFWESAALVTDGGWSHQGVEFQVQSTSYAVLRLWRLPGLGLTIAGVALCAVCFLGAAAAPPVHRASASLDEEGLVISLHGASPRLGRRWSKRARALQERIASEVAGLERER